MKKNLLSFSILIAAMLFFATAYAQVVSSGFETWTAGKPDGWWGAKTNIAAGSVTQYTANVHGGTSAVKLVNQTTSHKRFTTQPVSVVSGTVYTVSFWVRGSGEVRIGFYDGRAGTSAGYAVYSPYTQVNSTAWQQVTYNDTAQMTTASAEFIISVVNTTATNDDIQIDDFQVTGGSTNPSIAITSPAAGSTIYNNFANVSFAVANFTVGTTGHIHYNIDGGSYQEWNTSSAFTVSGLSAGSHTVNAMLVDNNHQPLSPMAASSVTFTVDLTAGTVISSVAALRAANADNTTLYRLTSDIVITHIESSIFNKFIQDNTAGILVYDNTNQIPASYVEGHMLNNLVGKLTTYNGMLEFIPVNAGTLVSTGNSVTPQVVTLSDFNTNFETYESKLIQINSVTFENPTGNFVAGKAYKLTNSVDSFRCSFYTAYYIGQPVPTNAVSITGIPNERTAGKYITAKYLWGLTGVQNGKANELSVYPNPANNVLNIANAEGIDKVEISNILGQSVMKLDITENNQSVNISSLKKGVYIVSLFDNAKRVKTIKITKE